MKADNGNQKDRSKRPFNEAAQRDSQLDAYPGDFRVSVSYGGNGAGGLSGRGKQRDALPE